MAYSDIPLTGPRWGNASTVTLVVGELKISFHVHEAILCKVSPVFKAAFTSTFKEGLERKMTLPDDDADLFNLLVEWLYAGSYNIPQPTGHKDKDAARFMEFIRLYVLADKYGVTSLKNEIVKTLFDALKQNHKTGPNADTVAYVYENLPGTSPIRRLPADFYVCNDKFAWCENVRVSDLLRIYPEFAADVVSAFVRHAPIEDMRESFMDGKGKYYLERE